LREANLRDELRDGRVGGGQPADDPQAIDIGEGLVDEPQLAQVVGLEDGVRDRAADVGAGGTQGWDSGGRRRQINGALYQSWLILVSPTDPCQHPRRRFQPVSFRPRRARRADRAKRGLRRGSPVPPDRTEDPAPMCNATGIAFAESVLTRDLVAGKEVLEVGSLDVNGSIRPSVEALGPARYVGVDMASGPRVDEVVDAARLVEHFGPATFDVVVTTEMLEHIRDWERVVRNLKGVLRPGGALVVTTRSIGFPYHGYPFDFWRYEPDDMRSIFGDFEDLVIDRDSASPGIFVFARKPHDHRDRTPSLALYSIVVGRRRTRVSDLDIALFRLKRNARATIEPVVKTVMPGVRRLPRTVRRRVIGPIRRMLIVPVWQRLPTPVRTQVKRALGRSAPRETRTDRPTTP
jgi:SAM-dependent methyltransferase